MLKVLMAPALLGHEAGDQGGVDAPGQQRPQGNVRDHAPPHRVGEQSASSSANSSGSSPAWRWGGQAAE